MENFNIVINPKVGEIEFDLSDLKADLSERTAIYKELVITKDNLPETKKDLAMLRKVRTEIDDRKKEVKKAFLEPYNKFEKEVKEAFAIIDEPINHLANEIKGFEEERKAERLEECKRLYTDAVGDMADFIPFERMFNEKWLNATTKDKDITDTVEAEIIRVKNDINAIKALGSEIEQDCIEAYRISGTLTAAIQRNSDYLRAKSRVEPSEVITPIKKSKVNFVVSESDADRVREMLDFAEIEYKEV